MLIICHMKFHETSFKCSLVTVIKLISKYRFPAAAAMLLSILIRKDTLKCCKIFEDLLLPKFQDSNTTYQVIKQYLPSYKFAPL